MVLSAENHEREGIPLPQTSLEEAAYQYIRKGIISRLFEPGERLSEPSLAKELECSRTPVRAALRRLSTEGLVVLSQNLQARVAKPTVKDIDDAFLLRELQEAVSARLASERVSQEDVVFLWTLERDMRQDYKNRDLESFLKNNDAFHFHISRLADNSFLEQSVRKIVTMTDVFVSLLDPFYEWKALDIPSFNEHQILLEALAAHDPMRAEYAMRVHIRSTRSTIDISRLEKA
jgi:DNA-binding GntR family transcriptional regulator